METPNVPGCQGNQKLSAPLPFEAGNYGCPRLFFYEKIVVDAKVIEKITDREIGQMMNYLKVTGLRLGYILNFKHPKLEWKRIVQ
jgi:GxxExxY protein